MKRSELIAGIFMLVMGAIFGVTSYKVFTKQAEIIPYYAEPASTSFHFQIENMDFYQSSTTPFFFMEK